MTEDMIEDIQKEFEKLGTSIVASKIRARFQSSNLLSGTHKYVP